MLWLGEIMQSAKGYAALKEKSFLVPFQFQRRQLGPNDILINIQYCGVCHSDIHQVRNEWGGSVFPMVPGHEIVGQVARIGDAVKKFKIGDSVGVGCMVDSCQKCSSCREGLEQYCEEEITWTYNSLEKDQKSRTMGGYSDKIVVNEKFVLRIASSLSLDKTAPLLCAGITTYSPLRHWKVGPGQNVAVLGLGGLGHMAVKFASAMGAEVTVLSSSDKKRDDAYRLGAKNYTITTYQEDLRKLKNKFDLIINTVSATHNLSPYLSLLRRDATMVLLGVPEKPDLFHGASLIDGRRRLAGSLIGGIKETQEMLDFCAERQITSDVEVISIHKINEAYERMLVGDVRYRFVIDMRSL